MWVSGDARIIVYVEAKKNSNFFLCYKSATEMNREIIESKETVSFTSQSSEIHNIPIIEIKKAL
ncbi:MAG: hypothetical protein LVQ95_05685 [Candidatus Micrarchaeales archaeon]|nr:hypothetical protein [Candidatus Micrarchaeales archaeon]